MAAQMINAINVLKYITVMAHRNPKGRKPDVPEMYPIPDTKHRKARSDKPGSFGFIAKSLLAKQRQEGGG